MSSPEQNSADLQAGDPLGSAAPLGPTPLQPQPRAQKQRSNVFTMMLILSFAALVTGSVVLYLHLSDYGEYPWWELPSDVAAEADAR